MRTATNRLIAKLTKNELYRDTIPACTFVVACILALTGNVYATAVFAWTAAMWFTVVGIAKAVVSHRERKVQVQRIAALHTSVALELSLRQRSRAQKALADTTVMAATR